jgi:nuclear cap-binding protein subunit 2
MEKTHNNTVERLDRPSAYYQSKVLWPYALSIVDGLLTSLQSKRRRLNPEREDADRTEDPVDALKDATTLYVGNL